VIRAEFVALFEFRQSVGQQLGERDLSRHLREFLLLESEPTD
jgi:hypothetical protein